MADFTKILHDTHMEMIQKQPVFFVATAANDGRVNLSPKGYDTLRIFSPSRVAYLDLGGSGNETHAHLQADGRITLMFCNFEQPALILRIYGRGRFVLPQDGEWPELSAHFDILTGTRQIFIIDIESVQTSCGWGVPFMAYEKERDTLKKFHKNVPADKWIETVQGRTKSIDGLPTRPTDRYIMSDG